MQLSINKWLFLCAALVSLTFLGCEDFLDVPAEDALTSDNFFTTRNNVESFTVGAYATLKAGGMFANGIGHNAITSDVMRTAQFNSQGGLGTYRMSASNNQLSNLWANMYTGIATANSVVTQIQERVPEDADFETADLIGEARFIRAHYYFHLVRLFGDVPLVLDQVVTVDQAQVGRSSVAEVYNAIVADLEFAMANCLSKAEVAGYGRVSNEAATALLAKVLLWRGNYIDLGTIEGDAAADYARSAELAEQVINSGQYSLVEYYPDVFSRFSKYHDENLFEVQYETADLGGCVGCAMGISKQWNSGGAWTNILGTQFLYTFYDSTDLVRRKWTVTKASIERVQGELVLTSYENPRFFENLMRAKNRDATSYVFLGGTQSWPSWEPTRLAKFRRWPLRPEELGVFEHQSFKIHDPLLRYAEVLLIFAEATNEANNGPTEAAYDAVNQVRARARNYPEVGIDFLVDGISQPAIEVREEAVPDWNGMDYATFREEILNERVRELAGEQGCMRWYDLVRRGVLVEKIRFLNDFNNPLTGNLEPWWTNQQGPG
ncbi:MAG: RagB/SusD family nutrient uptake outer membrane protein, partial [Bacteroidota bacterium]